MRFIQLVLILFFIIIMITCTGARGSIRLDKINKPTSFSALIYLNGEKKVKDKDLVTVGKLEVAKHFWGLVYSYVELSSDENVINEINRQIARHNADGIIDLNISAKQCIINRIIGLNLLPIWPGCMYVTLSGNLVKSNNSSKEGEQDNE